MFGMSKIYFATRLLGLISIMPIFLFSQGCATQQGYYVLAFTGTVIGVEVSQNPATQAPQAKLGYNRGELAFVPTNRSGGENANAGSTQGAKDSAEVIMEIRYGGIFDLGPSSGIYQRLAVGETAVQQPGASLMFMRNASGDLSPEAAQKAKEAIETISSNP